MYVLIVFCRLLVYNGNYNTGDWGIIYMANYFLFLDELKSNKEYKHFCIGGCFVEESLYRNKIVKQPIKKKKHAVVI